jgi:hypothetical protein
VRALALAVLAAGCRPDPVDTLSDVRVAHAELREAQLGGFGLIGSGFAGSADLVVEDPAGAEHVQPVDLAGGGVGLLIEMSLTFPGRVELELPHREVHGNELFGRYRGVREQFVMVAGTAWLHLENDDGIRIDDTTGGVGIAIQVSAAWLGITVHVDDTGLDRGSTSWSYGTETGGSGRTWTTETGGSGSSGSGGAR